MLEDIIIPEDPTPGEVVNLIAKASSMLSRTSDLAIEARDEYRSTKSDYEFAYAKAYLVATGTVEERKAKAKIDSREEEEKMLAAEAKWRMIEAKHNDYDNLFVALRKIASMKETEMKCL